MKGGRKEGIQRRKGDLICFFSTIYFYGIYLLAGVEKVIIEANERPEQVGLDPPGRFHCHL